MRKLNPDKPSSSVAHQDAEAVTAKVQLTPTDWIDAATAVLIDKSIDAVRVDVLAKGLNVTRGSFYWHFKDRDDLLQQLLKTWRDSATEQLIERFERRGEKASVLISELLSLPFRGEAAVRSASIELAIRAWARRDDMARHVVNEVDAKRLAYTSQCFVALGFSFQEASTRSFLLYSYVITESLLRDQGTTAQRKERRNFTEKLLLSKA